MIPMRRLSIILIFAALALGPLGASADDHDARPIVVAQSDGKSLSEAVEQVRSAINQSGLEAVMESSSAQADGVRARLRVGERS